MTIAVTGATGQLGGHIINYLLERGVAAGDIVAIARSEEKAAPLAAKGVQVRIASYEDQAALDTALEGVDKLVLVSSSEVGRRATQHANIIKAAQTDGVKFIVYTSLLNLDTSGLSLAAEHRESEKLLAESGIDYALMRNGWYWENYASAAESGKAIGKFFGAVDDAKVSGAARKDFAEAAAVVVTTDGHEGKVYELAGKPALTYSGIAEALSKALGSDVEYVNQTVEEYQATLEGAGLPSETAQFVAEFDPEIAKGALYSESSDLQDLIGRESTPAAEALA